MILIGRYIQTLWQCLLNTIGKDANVKKSIVADGCRVFGTVEDTVLSHGVTIGEGSIVKDSVIMPNVKIGKNVVIENAMIGEGAVIEDNCTILVKMEV